MGRVSPSRTAFLTLDELAANPKLARCLPPDLAWRYHALPLAEDNGRVTVAMADPDDARAREAVVAALGPKSCVVKGPALAIDARLAEIWGEEARHRLRLNACGFPDPFEGELWDYCQALGNLLGAHLDRTTTSDAADALPRIGGFGSYDLVIVPGSARGKHCQPLIRQLLSPSTADDEQPRQQSTMPCACLIAQRPRWPLQRILLVICGESTDAGAAEWALRLARPSTATVTVLAVVPPIPAMYHGLARMEQGLAGLLDTGTPLGTQMHDIARRLVECKIDSTLRLRQGAPDQQIFRESIEGNHDLIVMATRPCHWWLRQLKGDPICSLLSQVDRPVLLAAPTIA